MQEYSFTVDSNDDNLRLDQYVQKQIGDISRSRIQKLITSGDITVNDSEVRGSYRPKEGDEIEVLIPKPQEFRLVVEDIPLNVVHEDDEIIVIDKPAGLVVHPAPGHYTGTLVNALLHHVKDFKGISGQLRPGLVHRLDMETSGLLVVAKSERALNFLSEEMKERRIKRQYIAFVWGHTPDESGKIEAPIGRSKKDRKKMTVTDYNSREAVTEYERIERFSYADKLKVKLKTGRTHQIRVHLAHIGHPVIGDADYGGRESALGGIFDQYRRKASEILKILPRQALHAYRLSFKHPVTALVMTFESGLPPEIAETESLLRQQA